jgi:hypothetical protein
LPRESRISLAPIFIILDNISPCSLLKIDMVL